MYMLWVNYLAAIDLLVSLRIHRACNSHNALMENKDSKFYYVYKGISPAEISRVQINYLKSLALNFQ
jgi:hypothetical protein